MRISRRTESQKDQGVHHTSTEYISGEIKKNVSDTAGPPPNCNPFVLYLSSTKSRRICLRPAAVCLFSSAVHLYRRDESSLTSLCQPVSPQSRVRKARRGVASGGGRLGGGGGRRGHDPCHAVHDSITP